MNLKEMKKLTDLYGYIVKPEKSLNKVILHRIFYNNSVQISLVATVWNIHNYKEYKKYKAQLDIEFKELEFLNYTKIKKLLLEDIFSQVIKNNILML